MSQGLKEKQIWSFKMTKRFGTCDIETRGLDDEHTYVVCFKDGLSGKLFTFVNEDYLDDYREELEERCKGRILPLSKLPLILDKTDVIFGHNFMYFDRPMLKKFMDYEIPHTKIKDTLIMSKLLFPSKGFKHGLDAWGERLKYPKLVFKEFDTFSVKMCVYCERDTELNHKLALKLINKLDKSYEKPFRLESEFVYNVSEQKQNGFFLDVPFLMQTKLEMDSILDRLEKEIQKEYPPKPTFVDKKKPVTPIKFKKDGSISIQNLRKFFQETGYSIDHINGVEGAEENGFCFIEWQDFNLASPSQVVERLDEAGWRPVDFNKPSESMLKKGQKKGSPKVNAMNLSTLPEDAPQSAKKLAYWRKLFTRRNMCEQWLDAVDDSDFRLRGDVNNIGSWSQRCSHSNPNTANIASASYGPEGVLIGVEGNFGWDSRRAWCIKTKAPIPKDKPMAYQGSFDTKKDVENFLAEYKKYGRVLIGCDAEGIQLRALAHYMNDEEYMDSVANGDKKKKTDVHNMNLKLTKGILRDRDMAKTFIYAFLLGAGLYKLGVIADAKIGQETKVGTQLKNTFLEELPALDLLRKKGPYYVRQGWFPGLDGRKVPVPSNHLFLTALLQSFEAIIMKEFYNMACRYFRQKDIDAFIVGFVHDEIQVDCKVEDAPRVARALPKIMTKVGESLNSRIRIDGSSQVGLSWADSH